MGGGYSARSAVRCERRDGSTSESGVSEKKATSSPSSLQPPLLRRLAVLHSLALFSEHRYDLAIDAFISLDITPSKVVSLYPQAISGKLYIEHSGHEELFGGRSQHKVAAAIEDEIMRKHEAEEEEKKRVEEEKKKAPTSPAKKGKAGAAVDDDDASSIRNGIGRLKGKASWIKDSSDVLEQIADRAASQFFLSMLTLPTPDLNLQQSRPNAKPSSMRSATPPRSTSSFATSPTVDKSTLKLSRLSCLPPDRLLQSLALEHPAPSCSSCPTSPSPISRRINSLAWLRSSIRRCSRPISPPSPSWLDRCAGSRTGVRSKRSRSCYSPPRFVPSLCPVALMLTSLPLEQKYRELLDLYNGKNMHEKAVKLLRQ